MREFVIPSVDIGDDQLLHLRHHLRRKFLNSLLPEISEHLLDARLALYVYLFAH